MNHNQFYSKLLMIESALHSCKAHELVGNNPFVVADLIRMKREIDEILDETTSRDKSTFYLAK